MGRKKNQIQTKIVISRKYCGDVMAIDLFAILVADAIINEIIETENNYCSYEDDGTTGDNICLH